MITYEGILPKNKSISILRFKNENGSIVDIPIDKMTANTINLHLGKFSGASSSVERKNFETSEDNE
jgi:hypothetical protein